MKTRPLSLSVLALFVAGGLWAARAAWRAHHDLVTLNVREMPLSQVLRKIEWQTWKKIRAEKTLDARVTIHVKDKPLSYVLGRLAEQAGARWSTLYAVYDSAHALQALDSALRDDGKIEAAGWTKLAPNLPVPDDTGPEAAGPSLRHGPGPGGSEPPDGRGGPTMFLRRGNTVFQQGADGHVEVWTPEELIMESSLSARLGSDHSPAATAQAAAAAAREVHGHWTTFFAFHKTSTGIAFGGLPPPRPGFDHPRPNPNDRFARLTPEQRVQRARERHGFSQK